ncbi:hypothetical protein TNCV_4820511 [Trichonephila clavipes]|nr:hypothetical protein TNCV_4820511 [Trichonephila clavipes]
MIEVNNAKKNPDSNSRPQIKMSPQDNSFSVTLTIILRRHTDLKKTYVYDLMNLILQYCGGLYSTRKKYGDVSETHSEKRKFGKAGESSANKKARREVSKKYGKFTEDCIPDGVLPIGDDVFVFASTYYDSVSVHIRRFKKYGKTYYPTPEGITLDPRWIEYIMRKKKVPASLEELPSGLFPPERHIQITSENFIDFTFKRIKYGPDKEPTFKEITISREQWAEMIKKYGAIENAAIDNMFQCMDFLTAYKTFCEGPIENALPSSLDVSLGQQYLTQILKKSICDNIYPLIHIIL